MELNNNLAIMSYSFHGLHNCKAMNIFGYLESVKYRYNLVTADIWNGFLDYPDDDDYIDMVAKSIKERGLTVVNFCCDESHIWDNDPQKRADNEKRARRNLLIAEKIGAKSIRMDMGVREEVISPEQFDYMEKKYTEYCGIAAKIGARLGPENHWGAAREFGEFKRFVEHMVKKAPNFGILLHIGGWHDTDVQAEQDNHDVEVINYAMHMHLDFEHSMRATEIIPRLKEKGYYGCWTVEHHTSTNEYNNVALQLTMLKNALVPFNYNGAWESAPPSVKE